MNFPAESFSILTRMNRVLANRLARLVGHWHLWQIVCHKLIQEHRLTVWASPRARPEGHAVKREHRTVQLVHWFQVNRRSKSSTAPTKIPATAEMDVDGPDRNHPSSRGWTWMEVALIAICFGIFAGQIPPDVNESHYLTKAKHFWNPNWCPNDIFLSSSFSHLLFYASTGWITRLCSLSVYAWIGRVFTWVLLAVAWQRLSFRLIPNRGMAVVSAVLFLILNDRFQMAGEWVVGGFEAKGLSFAMVLFALEKMVAGKWSQVWILTGIASAFHVLVGGWATLAALISWMVCSLWGNRHRQQWIEIKSNAGALSIGLVIALVGILPPLLAEWQTSSELSKTANEIYVQSRISHHLLFGSFPTLHIARFALVTLAWISFSWFLRHIQQLKPIQVFCVASLLISFCGLMLSGLAEHHDGVGDLSRKLLRFYWFRLSDFAVPVALSLSCSVVVSRWMGGSQGTAQRYCGWLFVILILAATGIHVFEKNADPRPVADQRSLPSYELESVRTIETYRNWRKVCAWIAENTPPDSCFITPMEQQTFKWYAGRAEVASWKDIPQDAEAIVEWHRRIIEVTEPQRRYDVGLMAFSDEQLAAIAQKYEADYLLVRQSQVNLANPPSKLKRVYPADSNSKTTYVVFEFEQ